MSEASAAPAGPSDAEAARQLVYDYKAAIFERNGARAADLASSSTHAYFDKVRLEALRASASKVRGKRLMDQLMVLTLRARMPVAELQRLDGRGLFGYAVEQGWVGEDARQLEPAEISVDGDVAQIGLSVHGQTLPPSSGFRAVREEGGWKLDIMSITKLAEPALAAMLEGVDPDREQAILKILSAVTGAEVTADIWKPLVTQP